MKLKQRNIWNSAKLDKLDNSFQELLPPQIIEGYKPNKFNIKIWRDMSHKTKSVDLKLQIV